MTFWPRRGWRHHARLRGTHYRSRASAHSRFFLSSTSRFFLSSASRFFLSSASSFFRSPTAGSSSGPPPVSQPLAFGRADVRFVVRPPCSAAYEAGPLLAAGLGVPGFWLVSCVSRMISHVARWASPEVRRIGALARGSSAPRGAWAPER